MRNVLIALLFALTCTASAADRELTLARSMLEDAILRDDAEGIRLARTRLVEIAADGGGRDAHSLIALSAFFESTNAYRDAAAARRLVALGIRHADRAIELDPNFADGWMLSSALRWAAQRAGVAVPADPQGAPNRFARALELDAKSPVVAYVNGMVRSMNPAGPALPQGIRLFDEMAERSDGFWDAQAEAWKILVRMASDEPRAETLRPMAAKLLERHPDFALAQMIADGLVERRLIAAPSLPWKPLLTDADRDGKNAALPDVVAVDRADDGHRVWFRVTFREKLPRSFGVNIVANRSGDPATGMRWWGDKSTFHFDRLVTAWISRDGDRYFGRLGVTDEDGARGVRFAKLSGDVAIAMSGDDRSVILGVPRVALGLTDASTIVVAGGSHLVWNDDATSAVNSR
jgi:hypothetical protein